jgi:predicted dehydrogenase
VAPDIVLLAIPLPPRAPYFAALADKQTIILAEKPMANTLAEHDALGQAFPEWRLAAGYQRRYYAQFKLMQKILNTNSFGPLRAITISEGGRTTRSGGGGEYVAAPWSAGGGVVKNLGCHALDVALWLTGATEFTLTDNDLQIDGGADFVCRAKAVLKTAQGGDCALIFAVSWIDRMDNMISFSFDHVRLTCPVSPASAIEVSSPSGAFIGHLDATNMGATSSAQAFFLEWQDVIAAGLAKTAQPLSASATRPVARFMDLLLAKGSGA